VKRTIEVEPSVEKINQSSPTGLHKQAGNMTASDDCASRITVSCGAGAIHT